MKKCFVLTVEYIDFEATSIEAHSGEVALGIFTSIPKAMKEAEKDFKTSCKGIIHWYKRSKSSRLHLNGEGEYGCSIARYKISEYELK